VITIDIPVSSKIPTHTPSHITEVVCLNTLTLDLTIHGRCLNPQNRGLVLAPALLPAYLSLPLAPPAETPPAGPYDAGHHFSCHARN
jgi:hypothetical protein